MSGLIAESDCFQTTFEWTVISDAVTGAGAQSKMDTE